MIELSVKGCTDPRGDYRMKALRLAPDDGLVLEFGVCRGTSLRQIAATMPHRRVYGFDSFKGLPEEWITGENDKHEKGYFACNIPRMPANVTLVPGWFADTLPQWMQDKTEAVAFLHMDSDLYSSAKCVLSVLNPLIKPSTIILFDELRGYQCWQHGEWRALQEWLAEYNRDVEYLPSPSPATFLSKFLPGAVRVTR